MSASAVVALELLEVDFWDTGGTGGTKACWYLSLHTPSGPLPPPSTVEPTDGGGNDWWGRGKGLHPHEKLNLSKQ